jgi:hypothetical protein
MEPREVKGIETPEHLKHIKGWGVDADPADHPNYPIKHYTGDDHSRLNWHRPTLQTREDVEILMSTERPFLPAVYGTNLPPRGLSGAIRRAAFQYSENRYRHWLPLLMADRVNVVEGVLTDLAKGHVPNVYKERGWDAEWKYNRGLLVAKIAVRAALVAGAAALIYRAIKRRQEEN